MVFFQSRQKPDLVLIVKVITILLILTVMSISKSENMERKNSEVVADVIFVNSFLTLLSVTYVNYDKTTKTF